MVSENVVGARGPRAPRDSVPVLVLPICVGKFMRRACGDLCSPSFGEHAMEAFGLPNVVVGVGADEVGGVPRPSRGLERLSKQRRVVCIGLGVERCHVYTWGLDALPPAGARDWDGRVALGPPGSGPQGGDRWFVGGGVDVRNPRGDASASLVGAVGQYAAVGASVSGFAGDPSCGWRFTPNRVPGARVWRLGAVSESGDTVLRMPRFLEGRDGGLAP